MFFRCRLELYENTWAIWGVAHAQQIDQTTAELLFWELPYRFSAWTSSLAPTVPLKPANLKTLPFPSRRVRVPTQAFLGPSAKCLEASTMSCRSILWVTILDRLGRYPSQSNCKSSFHKSNNNTDNCGTPIPADQAVPPLAMHWAPFLFCGAQVGMPPGTQPTCLMMLP